MNAARSSHTNRLRVHALEIFGDGFQQKWFATQFDRSAIEELQVLSGAYSTTSGKKYRVIPPILFPNGSTNKKEVFLNPALVNVSLLFDYLSATSYTDEPQVLKVVLFGPSSLHGVAGKASGPKAAGIKWGLREVTPGAIAFAAVMVGIPLTKMHFIHTY